MVRFRIRLDCRSDGDQPVGSFCCQPGHSRRGVSDSRFRGGALGNVSGRILSGWLSDALGRLSTLRVILVIATAAMPVLYKVGANVAALYLMVFVVCFCYSAPKGR